MFPNEHAPIRLPNWNRCDSTILPSKRPPLKKSPLLFIPSLLCYKTELLDVQLYKINFFYPGCSPFLSYFTFCCCARRLQRDEPRSIRIMAPGTEIGHDRQVWLTSLARLANDELDPHRLVRQQQPHITRTHWESPFWPFIQRPDLPVDQVSDIP